MSSATNLPTSIKITILLVALLTTTSFTQPIPDSYSGEGTIELIPNILNLGYSADQSLLAVLQIDANGYFYTYNGIRYTNQQKILITDDRYDQISPSSFAFSPQNDLLAIGTKEGGVYGFKIDSETQQLIQPQAYSYRMDNVSESWVRSVDISSEGKIVIGS